MPRVAKTVKKVQWGKGGIAQDYPGSQGLVSPEKLKGTFDDRADAAWF